MQIKCDYCGGYLEDNAEVCPNCGGPNGHLKRFSNAIPKTIEELKEWYSAHNLPPENVTRFFIGKNIKEAKAFGIYREGDRYIVYKNKADGSRAVRYEGTDEAYAVNELYLKLKDEIAGQKGNRNSTANSSSFLPDSMGKRFALMVGMMTVMCLIMIVFFAYVTTDSKSTGYYTYGNNTYYYTGNWYEYDGYDWEYTDPPAELEENWESYYDDDKHYADVSDFEDTEYYQSWIDSQSNSDDWDSDTWSSGDSWDSGGSDWDSDW